jgi:hypothetical protein
MQMKISLVIFINFLSIFTVHSLIDCDNVLQNSSVFIGTCNNKWHNLKPLLKPTQKQVGYAWIKYKLDKFFNSQSNAQAQIDGSLIPAVIGPDNSFYVVDDHHTLASLDYSGYDSTVVTLTIICDKRSLSSMDAFWSYLEAEHFVYLVAHPWDQKDVLPVAITPSQIPVSFSFTKGYMQFSNDPWRSLTGYSRKVTSIPGTASCPSKGSQYCHRCMYRGCNDGSQSSGPGVPYFEFRWSYFMLDATYFSDSNYWPSDSDKALFTKGYEGINDGGTQFNDTISTVSSSEWLNLASSVIALCRSEASSLYAPPTDLYPDSDKVGLPGYVMGYDKQLNEDDPNCSSPVCH